MASYTYTDRVRRPAIIDNGRKQPIIRYTSPKKSYIVKRETNIVEHIRTPITEYGSTVHERDRPQTNYEVSDIDKYLPRSLSPNHDRPHQVQSNDVSQPRIGPLTGSYWPTSPNESNDRPHDKVLTDGVSQPRIRPLTDSYWPTGHTESTHDRPHRKVQTEDLSQPRIGPLTGSYWPTNHTESTHDRPHHKVHLDEVSQPRIKPLTVSYWPTDHTESTHDRPHRTVHTDNVSQPRIGPSTGSYWPTSQTESTSHNGWNKSSRNEKLTEQNMVNDEERSRSVPLGLTKPTSRMTRPTNDINEAVRFLTDAVKSSSINTGVRNSRYSDPVSEFSQKDGYMETIIDSSEAKKRYSRPVFYTSSESHNRTINSVDAIEKYGGAFVP